ncbi:MAG: hypothetical protein ACOY3P_04675 [Planctomycetota bacterium]
MAGQPVTKAKRFGEWEDRLWAMLIELADLMPRRDRGPKPSEGIDFWFETIGHLEWATIAASVLRYQLEDKAGLDAESLQAERERGRGLMPVDGTATCARNAVAAQVQESPGMRPEQS